MPHSTSRWLATGLVLAGVGADAAPRPVVDRFYDCRVIARSTEFPFSVGGASMSASGTVAFLASPSAGIEEIRVGRGDLDGQGVPISHAIARSGGNGLFIESFSPPSINDSGRVAFGGVDENSVGGVWILSPNHDPTAGAPKYNIVVPPFVGFVGTVGSGEINAAGVPLFLAIGTSGPQSYGLFRGPNQVIDLTTVGSVSSYVSTRGVGDDYAFEANTGQFPDPESQLFVSGGLVDSVANGAIVGLSIAGGRASYVRFDSNGDWRLLVTGQGGPPASERVDSTEDAIDAINAPGLWPATSINGYGDVAFAATDATLGGRRIFVADGQQIHRVVCQNGIRVGGALGSRFFSGDGQIVFSGALPDETLVVARADPIVGLPTSCSGLSDGVPCDDGDPETDATCTAGECVGEGPDRPTSCVGLPNDTPCDDDDPYSFAFCESEQCVTAPEAEGALAAALATLAILARSRRRRMLDRTTTAVH